jgi:membrane protease YdiL (CAAX protease family)
MGIADLLQRVIFTFLLPTNITLWILAIRRSLRQQPLVPWSPRRNVPWEFIDLLAVLLASLATVATLQLLVQFLLEIRIEKIEDMNSQQRMWLIFASSIGLVLASLIVAGLIRWRTSATLEDLGFAGGHLAEDVRVGLIGFAMLILPILLVQAAFMKLFPEAGQHPFVDLIRQSPDRSVMIVILFLAVGIAPISEEFLFRVLLQGWLEKVIPASSSHSLLARSHAAQRSLLADATSDTDRPKSTGKPLFFDVLPPAFQVEEEQSPAGQNPVNWWPIVISSFAFAAMHLGHGPAPIPLFLLALGLGYLYQRSHRIWPSWIVHVLVNLLAVLQLAVTVEGGA